jgi:fumarate hydratase, class II
MIMANYRIESDSMGEIKVESNKYWGAQTQRSLHHFSIGEELIPIDTVHALALIKRSAALANNKLGLLPDKKCDLIVKAADELLTGKFDDQFPLRVWMTGSGTQSNMNVNEVISNRAIEIAGAKLGSKTPIHPNDHVNMSQSSNDVFPTAMHISIALKTVKKLLPALENIHKAFDKKAKEWAHIVKIGRTHMQDAVPLTFGQEFSGYASMIEDNIEKIKDGLKYVYPLTLGGTAVGTGINTHPDFATTAISNIAEYTKSPFVPVKNRFAAQGSHDALVGFSGILKTLANSLFKIANDIRLLSCGPRCGFDELAIPENEPGSSIMPGKVNPTQCEAMAMVAAQVMGCDVTNNIAGASGYLEMNVYKTVMDYNIITSIRNLSDTCNSFTEFLLEGTKVNIEKTNSYVENSLMLVTALSPHIGYDNASKIAHHAFENNLTLKKAALELKMITAEDFDSYINPLEMTNCDR